MRRIDEVKNKKIKNVKYVKILNKNRIKIVFPNNKSIIVKGVTEDYGYDVGIYIEEEADKE